MEIGLGAFGSREVHSQHLALPAPLQNSKGKVDRKGKD
jgi:hypothetical protein